MEHRLLVDCVEQNPQALQKQKINVSLDKFLKDLPFKRQPVWREKGEKWTAKSKQQQMSFLLCRLGKSIQRPLFTFG